MSGHRWWLGLGAVVCSARLAGAVVTGAIYGPGSAAFPIAVMPLRNEGGDTAGLGARFAAVLSRDLDLSGYFKLVDPKTFIEDPQTSGTTAAETDFVGWATLGAQAVVKGSVSTAGDSITLEVRLFDVAGRKDVAQVGRRYSGARADLPRMAHKTADAILEFLTGERGPFDSQLVLVSNRAGRLKDVYLWTFDRDEPTRLTDERSIVVAPRWRPGGKRVLFVSYREHFPRLFEFDLASRRTSRLLPTRAPALGGAWSPNGESLLVTHEEGGNADIDLVDPSSGRVLRQLTDHWGVDVSPSWAPDGQRFAFCSSRSGSPQIYVMNADGSGLERVSFTGSYNTSPAWAPKGDRLAWVTRSAGFQVVVGTIGGSAQTITSGGRNEDPTWSPDGRYLIFSASRGGRQHLVLADREGKTQKELTHGAGDDTSPAWSGRAEQ
jgi:TolB protein